MPGIAREGTPWGVEDARPAAPAEVDGLGFLAAAAGTFTACDGSSALVEAVVNLAVPAIADHCTLHLASERASLRPVAERHCDPALQARARELEQRQPGSLSRAAAAAAGSGQVAILAAGAAGLEPWAALGCHWAMVLPLRGSEPLLGVLTLAWGASSEMADARQSMVKLAQAYAALVALALGGALRCERALAALAGRDELLSVAAHELRTPLASLMLALQTAGRGPGPPPPAAVAHKLRVAERQADRLVRLVDKLLDLSRIGAGRLDLQLEEVELAALAREAVARLQEEAARAGSPVRVEAPRPVKGRWDRIRLEQVLANLLSNALKYGQGQPVEVSVASDGPRARLTVRDGGLGIPVELQQRIFDRFERAVSGRQYGGLGLGLWIVRQIVEALGGNISVESVPGAGSTFTVWLPRGEGAAGEPPPA